jgi:hypothetical protein
VEQIKLRLGNSILKDAPEADIQIKRFKIMNTRLRSLRDGKIPRLYHDSVVGLRYVLRCEEQVINFLVDEDVVTLDVVFIHIGGGSSAKEVLDLVGTFNSLVRLQVMNWLIEKARPSRSYERLRRR